MVYLPSIITWGLERGEGGDVVHRREALRGLQRYTVREAYAPVSGFTPNSESIPGVGASLLTERKSLWY